MNVNVGTRIFIHATNVHQGGGRYLLDALLHVININLKVVLSLDSRMSFSLFSADNIIINRVKPTVIRRIFAEWLLASSVTSEDKVLCFGNLPPLFKLKGYTTVFIQNRYLIDNIKLNKFPIKIRIRLIFERLWLGSRIQNANEFIVQTPTMKRLLEEKTQGTVPVRILPFVSKPTGYERKILQCKMVNFSDSNFVYVASGEPHKNHLKLIEAWRLLADEGYFPTLFLTLSENRFTNLCCEIDVVRQNYNLKVINTGELSHEDVFALYANSDAVIYPSTFESFGLPLIEARQACLPVLASELDYVRDVIDPDQTFDPESSLSIARAVKRFLNLQEDKLPLIDANGFFCSVFGDV